MTPLLDAEVVAELVLNRQQFDGHRVRSRRKSMGLKLADLAQASGLTDSALSRIENGLYVPRDAHKLAIAAVLGREVIELWVPISTLEIRERAMAA